MEKRLFLLDAYALIFRAYYALIKMPRITSTGFNTSAIFGFVNTLEEVLRKEHPSHIAVCFDPAGPTFRNEAYDKYKAERAATPEDIKLSVPIIKEIVKAYNIPVVEVPGFEADDVIGSLATMAQNEGFITYMMTPDKDFGQLVTDSILQYKPAYRGQDFEIRGVKEVCERYGLHNTHQVIDLLALMGDKIDNIPGCPGVGEKTAEKLIADFGSVENLLNNTDQLKGALKKKVEENSEQITFSKFLATIRTDVPVGITPDELQRKEVDRDKLFAIFRELEFKTLIDRIGRRLNADQPQSSSASTTPVTSATPKSPKPAKSDFGPSLFDDDDFNAAEPAHALAPMATADSKNTDYRMISDDAGLQELEQYLQQTGSCGITLLAEGENDMGAQWIGTAIATAPGCARYIPTSFAKGVDLVLNLLTRQDVEKVSANIKRDYVLASRRGGRDTDAVVNYYDIGLAHYLLQPEMRHNVSDLANTYLHYQTQPMPEPEGRRMAKPQLTALSSQQLTPWACEQADITLQLREPLDAEVKRENMDKLLYDVELPLARVLADMELCGVRIDVAALDNAAREMQARIDALEQEIHTLAGTSFNVGSPAKVGEILFDKLQLDPKAKKTKTGQYSTSEEVLEKLSDKHPIVSKILEYRALKKLVSTYLTALPACINPATGKIHTNYNQTVTATGRISSSSPNLQNIPVRDDEGKEIRRAFIADPGHLFLSADYSQIELRLVADFANDGTMLEAFREGDDIHAATAAKIYHKKVEDVTSDERRHAKTANFGILYGISAFGLANRLSIPRADANALIDNYFATFPTIRQYMTDSIEQARRQGYVTTRMGRKRILPDINSRNPVVRGYAERNAINAPVQGSAADIIKVAMVAIDREMRSRNLKSKMIMQVHDELNFDVVPEELPELQELVSRLMQAAYQGRVALTADSGVASNWLDAH